MAAAAQKKIALGLLAGLSIFSFISGIMAGLTG